MLYPYCNIFLYIRWTGTLGNAIIKYSYCAHETLPITVCLKVNLEISFYTVIAANIRLTTVFMLIERKLKK